MKTLLASWLLPLALLMVAPSWNPAIAAQPAPSLEHSVDLLPARPAPATIRQHAQVVTGSSARAAAVVTNAQVGDADSFGREQVYLGLGQTLPVVLSSDCTGIDPSTTLCQVLAAAPAATSFSALDLGRIELPASVSHSLLCFTLTPFVEFEFNNPAASVQSGTFSAAARIVIQNLVLDDPALIDPNTGLPFGGQFELELQTYREQRSLAAGEVALKSFEQSRSCIGGLISRQTLIDSYGLTAAQSRQFFRAPMVLRLGSRGSVRLVDRLSYFYGIRIYGDAGDDRRRGDH